MRSHLPTAIVRAATVASTTSLSVDHRRATAERNLQAILDAAERLLENGEQASIAAVAKQAGVSRVTVYAHFDTREELLEAVVARAVRQAARMLRAARLQDGSPIEALHRLVSVSWREVDRHDALARAATADLSATALRRSHAATRVPLRKLIRRGREEGAFRTDVPEEWLITVVYALMHAAVEDVRAGRVDGDAAPALLAVTIGDLFIGRRG
jgi:TetR/AcrR family transcriptional repressor of mexCD-oprJ operon